MTSWTDHVINEEVSQRAKVVRCVLNILRKIKSRKANWIGHILLTNCILKHVIEVDLCFTVHHQCT